MTQVNYACVTYVCHRFIMFGVPKSVIFIFRMLYSALAVEN